MISDTSIPCSPVYHSFYCLQYGCLISRGRYLHFLDDDDYLQPGEHKVLRAAAEENSAAWIYGRAGLVKEDGEVLADHHIGVEGDIFVQVMAGEWLPLQISLIRADVFFEAGFMQF